MTDRGLASVRDEIVGRINRTQSLELLPIPHGIGELRGANSVASG
jgi:hypothetical protein